MTIHCIKFHFVRFRFLRREQFGALTVGIDHHHRGGVAKEFRQLGNILNGIVKEYNTTGFLDEEATEAVLAKINERAAHLRDELIEKTVDLEVKRYGDQK